MIWGKYSDKGYFAGGKKDLGIKLRVGGPNYAGLCVALCAIC